MNHEQFVENLVIYITVPDKRDIQKTCIYYTLSVAFKNIISQSKQTNNCRQEQEASSISKKKFP